MSYTILIALSSPAVRSSSTDSTVTYSQSITATPPSMSLDNSNTNMEESAVNTQISGSLPSNLVLIKCLGTLPDSSILEQYDIQVQTYIHAHNH